MAANNGVHTPDEERYYHCNDKECACQDGAGIYKDINEFLAALEEEQEEK